MKSKKKLLAALTIIFVLNILVISAVQTFLPAGAAYGRTRAMLKIQDTNLICAPVPSQLVALAALRAGRQRVAPQLAELARVREIVGEMPLLVPGIGAQGGDVEATLNAGRTASGKGMIINNSRAILYAGKDENFAQAARQAAQASRELINRFLG